MKFLCFLERNFERTVLTGSLIVMAAVLIMQVVMRYFFRAPFVWSEELARYILVWCAVLGVSLAVRESRNISVDFLPTIIGVRSIRFFTILAHIGVLAFSIVMVTASIPLIQRLAAIGQLSPALGIPMWLVYAAVPVGFGLAGLRTLQALACEFLFTRPVSSEEGKI